MKRCLSPKRRRYLTGTSFSDQVSFRHPESDIYCFLLVSLNFSAGGFGQVVEARCRSKGDPNYGQKFALKIQSNETDRQRSMNLEEVSLLTYCCHPNIVSLHRALEVRNEVWVVMELLKGGNLKQVASSKVARFNEQEIAYSAREMLQGIKYLHDHEVGERRED